MTGNGREYQPRLIKGALARKGTVSNQDADVIDAHIPKCPRFFGA